MSIYVRTDCFTHLFTVLTVPTHYRLCLHSWWHSTNKGSRMHSCPSTMLLMDLKQLFRFHTAIRSLTHVSDRTFVDLFSTVLLKPYFVISSRTVPSTCSQCELISSESLQGYVQSRDHYNLPNNRWLSVDLQIICDRLVQCRRRVYTYTHRDRD